MRGHASIFSVLSAAVNFLAVPAAAASEAAPTSDVVTALLLFIGAVLIVLPFACLPLAAAVVTAYRGVALRERGNTDGSDV